MTLCFQVLGHWWWNFAWNKIFSTLKAIHKEIQKTKLKVSKGPEYITDIIVSAMKSITVKPEEILGNSSAHIKYGRSEESNVTHHVD